MDRAGFEAYKCLQMQGISSRDLKLENLLLDRDGRDGTRPLLKICDFGYSKVRKEADSLSPKLGHSFIAAGFIRCSHP